MFNKLKAKLEQHQHVHPQGQAPISGSNMPALTDIDFENGTFDALVAGTELSARTFNYFYSPHDKLFCTPHNEGGTIDAQHGYVVWPVSICFWMAADTAKRSGSHHDKKQLHVAFEAMEKHWNPELGGYCAWHMFPGNRDIYFDDNVHCGNALITAYEASGQRAYLDRARDVITGIVNKGWDRSDDPGGVAWHIDQPNSRNACSTLSAAMFACRLALHGVEKAFCTAMARACIAFADAHLIDSDGLVLDAWQRDGDAGQWHHDARKFTYNTGFGIAAFQLWAQLSGERAYADRATRLALTAVDPESALFDRALPPQLRTWHDATYFAHHLVEALVLVAQAHGAHSQAGQAITSCLARFAAHLRAHIFDARDAMYFRPLRMYCIGQEQTDLFNREFGTQMPLEANQEDREQGDGPPEGRRLIKTLIANASVARCFMLTADLQRVVSIPRGCLEHLHS